MANKSINEITLDLIDFFKVSLPEASTQAGSVVRDLFIDVPASQLALLYDYASSISNLQSLRLVSGSDLDKLAQNLGASKKSATPSSGIALFTFNSLTANVGINAGDIVTAKNGSNFIVANGISVDASKANSYKAVATKYQNDLNFLNITDTYAVEVTVKATVPGIVGNIPKYSLVRSSSPGVSNITNVFSFSGGSNQEDDATFRNRVLAIFSGSNIGTALGYRNTALTNSFVRDALVISPGDPLMTRDGSIVGVDATGNDVVVSEGTGGKVDVVILGTNLNENIDTFIYRDKSNANNPSASRNNVILGQIPGDENKTITRKRIDNIAAGRLPAQPIEEILEVTGSLSGGNFTPKSTDSLGRVTGNYQLVKDTGDYQGSPWSLDYFAWISDRIPSFPEDIIKGQFNGQDATAFTDVLKIPTIQQSISISNENSNVVNTDRSIVQLLHTPASNITRVVNTNTGERYTVVNQNFDSTSPFNSTGRIQISGNTLPSSSDVIQVDYTWIIDYDAFSDYDGKILKNNPRLSTDSIDWGMSNKIKSDKIKFTLNTDGSSYSGTSTHPISSIISVNSFNQITGSVGSSSVINFSDRLAVSLLALDAQINNIISVKISNTEKELYLTAESNGLFINNRVAIGASIKYNSTIIFPSDANVSIGDSVEIIYNPIDVFNVVGSTGSFINNSLTIPAANIAGTPAKIYLKANYIASTQNLLGFGINNLPISKFGNGFSLNNNVGSKNNILSNSVERQNLTVQKNVSNQFYVKLNLPSSDYTITADNIISVINISNRKEYWNANAPGSITVNGDGNYNLVFSGLNAPAIGDNVLAIFSFSDTLRTQPFTFANENIKYNIDLLDFNFSSNQFSCNLNTLSNDTALSFDVIDPTTGIVLSSHSDGYISLTDGYESINFNSISFDFSTLSNLSSKRILIKNSINSNNNGNYNILFLLDIHTIIISPLMNDISKNQISVIRLLDNKDLWSVSTCDIIGNTLTLPSTTVAEQGDYVIVISSTNQPLHQSPTRLAITLADQLTNSGVLTVVGTTITKVADSIFTATQNGLKQNLLESIKNSLGLASTNTIGSDKFIVRVMKVEKISTTINGDVLSSLVDYDTVGTELNNDLLYSNEMQQSSSLTNMEFNLPTTVKNNSNLPVIGDSLRITFAYATLNDYENLYFTRNGTLYTNKQFVLVNKIFASSGFNSSQSARFTVGFFTQPATGSRYRAFYDYLAPKQNERILIRSNFNQAILDTTFSIEASRPINADILVRAAKKVLIDTTINIVVKTDFSSSTSIVLQNVRDKITNAINTNILGDVINSSELIAAAQAVDGVERARVLSFNKDGIVGQVLTIVAKKDEYFSANDIVINQEAR
jgi:hypothetical protein